MRHLAPCPRRRVASPMVQPRRRWRAAKKRKAMRAGRRCSRPSDPTRAAARMAGEGVRPVRDADALAPPPLPLRAARAFSALHGPWSWRGPPPRCAACLCAGSPQVVYAACRRPQRPADRHGLVERRVLGAAVTTLWRACGGGAVGHGAAADPPGAPAPPIVLPIHEEDATRVFAAAAVMADLLARERVGRRSTCSCSAIRNRRSVRCAEAAGSGTRLARRCVGGADTGDPLSPPWRTMPGAKPATSPPSARNGAAPTTSWSCSMPIALMTGAAIARLIGAMEANPQRRPDPVHVLPGRSRQHCSPACSSSTLGCTDRSFNAASPSGRGHAAIIGATTRSCASGPSRRALRAAGAARRRPPFGGEILSHDTVEAALLLRGGLGRVDAARRPGHVDPRLRGRSSRGRKRRATCSTISDATAAGARAICSTPLVLADPTACASPRPVSLDARPPALPVVDPRARAWLALYTGLHRRSSSLDARPHAWRSMVAALIVAPRLLGVIATIVG